MEGLRDSSLGRHPMMLFPTNCSLIQWEPASHQASALSSGRGAHSLHPNSFQTSSVSSSHCELEPTAGSLPSVYVHMFVWVCTLLGQVIGTVTISLNSVSQARSQFRWGSRSKGVALWLLSPFPSPSHGKLGPWWTQDILGKMCWCKS